MTKQTSRDRVAQHFKARPGRRVSVLALVRIACCRYRQAISECRRDLSMNIVNEKRHVKGQCQSYYKLEPKDAA